LKVSVWHSAAEQVRLLDVKLGGILDDHDALIRRDEVASIAQKVVLPVPVPPLMSSVFPLRICSARKSASGRVSVPRAIRSSMCNGGWELAMISAGAGRTTGGMTAARRLPSGSCACSSGIVLVELLAELDWR
jgi:hypothetical protein